MTINSDSAATAGWGAYAGFLAMAAGTVAVLMLVGLLPTRRLGGEDAVAAMLAGCAVSLVGSILGTVPVALARDRSMPQAMPAILGSIVLRLGTVVALGVAVAATGQFDTTALVLWLVIAHAGLLITDTSFTLKLLNLPEKR